MFRCCERRDPYTPVLADYLFQIISGNRAVFYIKIDDSGLRYGLKYGRKRVALPNQFLNLSKREISKECSGSDPKWHGAMMAVEHTVSALTYLHLDNNIGHDFKRRSNSLKRILSPIRGAALVGHDER